jgi:predicted lipoprotein
MRRSDRFIEDPLLALVSILTALVLAGVVHAGGCDDTRQPMKSPHGTPSAGPAASEKITNDICDKDR